MRHSLKVQLEVSRKQSSKDPTFKPRALPEPRRLLGVKVSPKPSEL